MVSALHMAVKQGPAGSVAKLLSLGADDSRPDHARACIHVKT